MLNTFSTLSYPFDIHLDHLGHIAVHYGAVDALLVHFNLRLNNICLASSHFLLNTLEDTALILISDLVLEQVEHLFFDAGPLIFASLKLKQISSSLVHIERCF